MALSLICACGARFEVEDTLAGQDVACPECQQPLKAPALKHPSLRTSDLALSSTVLALVGAFTVIGTVAAVVVGALGLIRIRRNRDRVAGEGFAIFGITAGTIFTVLTLLALSSNELFGLGGKLRRSRLADKVDTTGELTHEDAIAGFKITRPSRDWGQSTVVRLEDPFVNMMQGPNARALDLLLVHLDRNVLADVRSETRNNPPDVDLELDLAASELMPAAFAPGRRKGGVDDGSSMFRITKVVPAVTSKRLDAGDGIEAREKEVAIKCSGQDWKMLVRVYMKGSQLYVVRAYGQKRHFSNGEADVRKLLDSFTILDGR
jgi:hypothetical protein